MIDGMSSTDRRREPDFVISIGASAGGLASVESFFSEVPPQTGLAFVVVQHLAPDYKSLMGQILRKHTPLPVEEATDGIRVRPDRVYLIPPGQTLLISEGRLQLLPRDPQVNIHHPIDDFFITLAEDRGSRAIAVILSGTGSDGTVGARAIKNGGGLVLVQDSSAQFDGMPRSVITTGIADFILPPHAIANQILRYTQVAREAPGFADSKIQKTLIPRILEHLHERTGHDFRNYKLTTLGRRIEKRMRIVRAETIEDYSSLVCTLSDEAEKLAQELMIGVTRFFRDPEAFDSLALALADYINTQAMSDQLLRVWVPGCSSGEEAYSIAILLHEILAARGHDISYKVFATDIDARAIAAAGRGCFTSEIVHQVSSERLKRHFVKEGPNYRISRRIRERIVFAPHNVVTDPPFTRMDLIFCRNLLIYQEPGLQDEVLVHFHFALNERGILFLGPSEGLGELSDNFKHLDSRWRVYANQVKNRAVRRLLQGPIAHNLQQRTRRPAAIGPERLLSAVASTLLDLQ